MASATPMTVGIDPTVSKPRVERAMRRVESHVICAARCCGTTPPELEGDFVDYRKVTMGQADGLAFKR